MQTSFQWAAASPRRPARPGEAAPRGGVAVAAASPQRPAPPGGAAARGGVAVVLEGEGAAALPGDALALPLPAGEAAGPSAPLRLGVVIAVAVG